LRKVLEKKVHLPLNQTMETKAIKPYMNPYLAGFGLGLVLFLAYLLVGRGLGASGGVASIVTFAVSLVAPEHAAGNPFFAKYLDPARAPHPLKDFLVFELIGVVLGAFLSGWFAGRVGKILERGPRISDGLRVGMAVLGGVLMAWGADLARGCTSGHALSGGAILNVGSWVFMMCVFGGGYAVAYFVRRLWR